MNKIQELRKNLKKSAEDIVRDLSSQGVRISRETIYRAEKTGRMSLRTAQAFSKFYNVDINEII